MMMMNRHRKNSPPPYFWKAPVPPEKDHMTENYRRMKSIAAEGQKKRSGPLKANFVPGVTKNVKYAHVQSKVTAALKTPHLLPPQKSFSEDLATRRIQQGRQFDNVNYHGPACTGARPRPSRSSHDLRNTNMKDAYYQDEMRQPRREVSVSASNVNTRPVEQSNSQPSVRILRSEPPDESIYKWRFNDDQSSRMAKNGDHTQHTPESVRYPQQHCHRVEYLPCDGICAEETHVDETNLDSARSTSSRTSRGCNTEETRIIADSGANSVKSFNLRGLNLSSSSPLIREQNNTTDVRRVESQPHVPPYHQAPPSTPKQKGVFTMANGNGIQGSNAGDGSHDGFPDYSIPTGRFAQQKRNKSSQDFNIITGDQLESGMKAMHLQNRNKEKNSGSVSSVARGSAGDLPHSLGTVPKYLKQRQQEWREEQIAKQEAEKTSHIPPGYVCLTESDRMDHLRSFKTNHDSLVAELNRIPITVDTIRVRDHKIQLEKQLVRLEEAMKTFSRPLVWIKADD